MITVADAAMVLACLLAGAAMLEFAGRPRAAQRRPRGAAARRGPSRRGPRWAAGPLRPAERSLARLVDAAGHEGVRGPTDVVARQRAAGILGAAWCGAASALVVPLPVAGLAALAGWPAGRLLPLVLLRRVARRRAARLRDEAPEVLELLAAALGCGLPVQHALVRTAQWSSGELAAGLAASAGELASGAATTAALSRLVLDHPIPELEAAVAILGRARDHGTPAEAPMRALAEGARQARTRRASEHAARAAPRIQLVAALLLVPAALCVLGAGLVAGGLS